MGCAQLSCGSKRPAPCCGAARRGMRFHSHHLLLPSSCSWLTLAGKPTLQYHRSRGAVDILTPDPLTPLTTRAPSFQRLIRLERRPALIDHVDRQPKPFFEFGSKAPRSGRKSPRCAIRIIRCPHHENSRMHSPQLALDRAPVRPALRDGYRRKWRSRRGERVTRGKSDPFESKIESEDGVD